MGVEQGSSWTDLWGSRFTWQGTVAGGRAGFVASVAVVGLGVVFAPVVAPVAAAATGVSAAATGCMVVAGGTTFGAAKGFVTDASNSSRAGAKAGGKFAREYYFPDDKK